MDLAPPSHDEIELSVFGREFGEALCIHLGNAEWMLVDSCIDPRTGAPAALSYLESLGINAADDVRLVIATHWHDDHVRGLGFIVQFCARATVVCSAALARKDIFAFVIEQEEARGAIGSGLDEFRTLLRICASENR